MIAMIDMGLESLEGIRKMLVEMDSQVMITSDPYIIRQADTIVLYGGSSYGEMMCALVERDLIPAIKRAAIRGNLVIGIGTGMQLLFTSSDEGGFHQGLNLLSGHVKKLPDHFLPYEGWSSISFKHPHPWFRDVEDAEAYFAQSFYIKATNPEDVFALNEQQIPAIAGRRNVVGLQFYPEKSEEWGTRFLQQCMQFISMKV